MPATILPKLPVTPAPAASRPRHAQWSADSGDEFQQAFAFAAARVKSTQSVSGGESAENPNIQTAEASPKAEKPGKEQPSDDKEAKDIAPEAAAEAVAAAQTQQKPADRKPVDDGDVIHAEISTEPVHTTAEVVVVPTDDIAPVEVDVHVEPQIDDRAADASETRVAAPANRSAEATGPVLPTAAGEVIESEPPITNAEAELVDTTTPAKPGQADAMAAPVAAPEAQTLASAAVTADQAQTHSPATAQQAASQAQPQRQPGEPALAAATADVASQGEASSDGQPQEDPTDGDASQSSLRAAAQNRATNTTADSAQRSSDFANRLNEAMDTVHPTDAQPSLAAGRMTQAGDRPAVPPSPQHVFAQQNHEQIVSSVRTQLLPNGGTMQIRLQPGDLGSMQISVRMVDGVMSASFQTSTDEASRLLSHSLSQLKASLEAHGIQVDRIQVTQAPRETQASQDNQPQDGSRQNPSREQQQQAHEENQRRLILNRMWRRMATGQDPLDLVA